MATGYIKLHRKLLDNCISTRPEYLALWVTLLLMANHAENSFIWNDEKITIRAGQLLTGLKQLSKKTGIAQTTVYRILKFLENEKQIEQHKTTKFTILTIVQWDAYQHNEQQSGKQTENKRKQTIMIIMIRMKTNIILSFKNSIHFEEQNTNFPLRSKSCMIFGTRLFLTSKF